MSEEHKNPFAHLGREQRAVMIFQLLDAELDATRRAAMRAKASGLGFASHVAAGKHIVRAHKAVAEALTTVIANDGNDAVTFDQHLAGEAELARSVSQLQAARAFEQRLETTVFGSASGRSIRRRTAPPGEVQPAAPGLFDKP